MVAFWASSNPNGAMPNGAKLMRRGDVAVHPVTVWEITHKIALGKLLWPAGRLPLSDLLHGQHFTMLPFTWEDAEAASMLPPLHKDPMDRMLIATALRRGMTVITSDRIFPQYGVGTIW